ncbi:MAG: antitoxin VbhA family protein [Solirubrobacteraceae bacterium]
MVNVSTERSLAQAGRERAAANALASVRAEGLDPSAAEPALAAWARGEIDTDQMIAATKSAAIAQLSTPPQTA